MTHLTPRDIERWLDDALSRRRRRHLEECASCRREAREHQLVAQALAALPRYAPRPGFADRVMAEVRTGMPAQAVRTLPASRKLWAAAAAFSGLSLVSSAIVTILAIANPTEVAVATSWLAAQSTRVGAAAVHNVWSWLTDLPIAPLVETALSHLAQTMALAAVAVAAYIAACYRLWMLLRLPRRGYAPSR